ncbi:MAG: hypothetical protein QM727_04345 [Niabella sp.]
MHDERTIVMNEHGCYFLILETTDAVDIFVRPVYKQIIVHSLNHFIDNRGFIVYGWCLMTNRLYLICQAQKNMLLGDIRKGFKQFTTEKIIEAVDAEPEDRKSWLLERFAKFSGLFGANMTVQCWKKIKAPVPVDIKRPEEMAEQLDIIHSIPIKERFVQYPSDFLYSSARDYEGLPGLVKITKLSPVEQAFTELQNRKSSFKARSYGK